MGTERLHTVVPGSISCQLRDRVADAHIARRKNMVRSAGAQRLGQSFAGLVGMTLEKPEDPGPFPPFLASRPLAAMDIPGGWP